MSAFDFAITLLTGGCLHAWWCYAKRIIAEGQRRER